MNNIYFRHAFGILHMAQYKRLNNLLGWLCFIIATTVYVMTMERTGSWWDCGEFISCAYRQQVPHQPGAPLYILIYKIFTLFAGNDRSKVAFWGNVGSAVCSAATIMFLFWTITALARKILIRPLTGSNAALATNGVANTPVPATSALNTWLIFGAGIVGALAYTFSDTFWFSAVEAEVYALASLSVAITFWAALKWEAVADQPPADRWLVFIAFMVGFSVGVHLLNLLTIPAVVFVVFHRRYDRNTRWGWLITLVIAVFLLGFVQVGVIPGTIQLAANVDRLFVNSFGLGMGSGAIFFFLLLAAILTGGILWSLRTGRREWNTAFLCMTFLFIGYAVFIQVPIRAHANPPLNNQHPDDPYNFLEYLTRSQYGDGAPLLKGPVFTSQPTGNKDEGPIFKYDGRHYAEIGQKMKEEYNSDDQILFPRIWDNDNRLTHVDFYKNWLGLPKELPAGFKPSWFGHNIRFFTTYQVGWMFGRYFMWNFAGRQNDIQGFGGKQYGNWISGITPLDQIQIGVQPPVPTEASPNLAHNTLFLLPFILGLIGIWFQYRRDPKDLLTLVMFFLFTGLAIVVFLNQTGPEPRERDYSFGGAFYTYCIWIGLGVLGVWEWLTRITKPALAAILSFASCLLVVPVVMARQEWDDHDRSHRTTVRDFASDYLNSCAPNAILFTYGDNDTYPLWYAQEAEGIRPDVRVVNLSLLGIDWYIKQMHEPMNQSAPLPFSLPSSAYFGNNRNIVPFNDGKIAGNVELKDIMELIGSNEPAAKVQFGDQTYNYFPTKNFKLTVKPEQIISTGTMPASEKNLIVPELDWVLPTSNLYKNDVAELDIINSNNWKRPIYFAKTLPPSSLLGLKDYLHLEGLAYRLLPVKAVKGTDELAQIAETVNLGPMYDNFMHRFKFGNINQDKFLDPESRSMVPVLKQIGWNLAYSLYKNNKPDSARKVLDYVAEMTPKKLTELDERLTINQLQFNVLIGSLYYDLKEKEKGYALLSYSGAYINSYLNNFRTMKVNGQDESVQGLLYMLQQLSHVATEKGDKPLADKFTAMFAKQAPAFGFGQQGQPGQQGQQVP